jgi:hypothetical protein
LEQAGRGELVPAEQVFARVRRRLGIRAHEAGALHLARGTGPDRDL